MKTMLIRTLRLAIPLWVLLMLATTGLSASAAPYAETTAEMPTFALADPPRILNYQGYLTDSTGTPFTGSLAMTAALYDSATVGSLRWGPESFVDVQVQNGLFHLALGSTEALTPEVFAQELWVEISVGGTVLPRQPLRPAPYAFALIPGARVVGAPADGDYGLVVANLAQTGDSTGIYARGEQVGIYATTASENGRGVYTPRAIEAGRGYLGPDSFIHITPIKGRAWDDLSGSFLTTNVGNNGSLLLRSTQGSCPCVRFFYIPVDVPSVLYGQDVTIEQVSMQYRILAAGGSGTSISRVSLLQMRDLTQGNDLFVSSTPLTSREEVTIYFPTNNGLNRESGALALRLELTFANNTDFVNLGNIRVRIGHGPGGE